MSPGRFFSSSSLRSINYAALFFELVIVFVGVYLAFVLSNYQSERAEQRERTRVLSIIDVGVERYEELFGGFVLYHDSFNEDFRTKLDSGTIPYFGSTVYPYPQYPIEAIDYVLTDASFDLVEIDLYIPLVAYLNGFQQIMDTERRLSELSSRYVPVNESDVRNQSVLFREQMQLARHYLRYLDVRRNQAETLNRRSTEIRQLLRPE